VWKEALSAAGLAMKRIAFVLLMILCAASASRSQDLGKVTGVRTAPTLAGLACDPNLGQLVSLLTNHRLYRCVATNTWASIQYGQPLDVTDYGAAAHVGAAPQTTANTAAGSPNVTIASPVFHNGQGVVIFKAGTATTSSTPAAPTVSSPFLTGSTSYHYACSLMDNSTGISAAGPQATLSTGPRFFGAPWVQITSAVQATGTVAVAFSAAINAQAGDTIDLEGLTGAGAAWLGFWEVASAPSNASITITIAGNAGAAGINASSLARLSNARLITAISRTGATITVTTNQPHNFHANAAPLPTPVIIYGVGPADLNGTYVLATASGSTFTINTGINVGGVTETGTVFPRYSVVAVPEDVFELRQLAAGP
jgi:hypothetical protein